MTTVAALSLLDLLLKSVAILGVFAMLERLFAKRIRSNTRHLLWLNAMICLLILPGLPALVLHAAPGHLAADPWFEITVTPTSTISASNMFHYGWLLPLYFVPTFWLLARMGIAVLQLKGIQKASQPLIDPDSTRLLTKLSAQMGITRTVLLMRSTQIDSPISFGLLQPIIIIPSQSHQWPTSVMTDVLLHELSHIKRMDWITLMLAWCVAAFYWINPLVWFAVRRLDDEAEHSCDTAVLLAGRSDTAYAESLLSVAQACRHSAQTRRAVKLPAQKMLERHTLKSRIQHILEDNTMITSDNKTNNHIKKSFALMLLVSAATLSGIGGTHLVSAQAHAPDPSQREVNEELIPLNVVEPFYPTVAANESIEGWVHVRFTVTAAGSVDPQSIEVIEAQPAGIFDASAMRATTEFMFSPRIRDGAPVDVPNVQYVFRYALNNNSERAPAP